MYTVIGCNNPAESNLRGEITVRSDEYDPVANPAYDGPMGVMTDYDGCDSDDTGFGEDEGDNDDGLTEAERAEERYELEMMREDESMDGDFDSGMASAGLGTAEDYGDYGGNDEY